MRQLSRSTTPASHQLWRIWMDHQDDEATRAKIIRVSRFFGEDNSVICGHCKAITQLLPHKADCLLRKLNPEELTKTMNASKETLRKEANRQRIFKSSRPYWNGLPRTGIKTAVRKVRRKRISPKREIKWCKVCFERMLFINNTCRECEHHYPCPPESACEACQ